MFQNGFAMTISATPRKRDKLAAQLTWLANRHILGLPEDRRHGRIVPRNPIGRLIMPNGVNLTCRIIDMSQSGAGIATDQRPPIGALVTLGKVQGRVVRHLEDGFAIEFTRLQHPGLPRRQRHRRVNGRRDELSALPRLARQPFRTSCRSSAARQPQIAAALASKLLRSTNSAPHRRRRA